MSKPAQVLEIDPPNEIVLHGPYTDIVTTYLKLTNPSGRTVAFKVKTTAPKQYCVRPNSGMIPAKSSANVAIMLQPLDANEKDRAKHKFMVQSAYVPDALSQEKMPLDTLWKSLPGDQLMDSKLRVVFDSDAGGAARASELDNSFATTHVETAPMSMSTASQRNQMFESAESDARRLADDVKRLQHQLQTAEMENSTLRDQLNAARASLTSGGGRSDGKHAVAGPGGFAPLHVALAAIAALLLGLLMGAVVF